MEDAKILTEITKLLRDDKALPVVGTPGGGDLSTAEPVYVNLSSRSAFVSVVWWMRVCV